MVVVCGGFAGGAGDRSSDHIVCLVQQLFIWEQLFLSPFGSSIWHSVQFIYCYAFSQVRCRLCALQTTL